MVGDCQNGTLPVRGFACSEGIFQKDSFLFPVFNSASIFRECRKPEEVLTESLQ